MNKTDVNADGHADRLKPGLAAYGESLGVRLLLLLLLAQVPLAVYTIAVSLQNDHLRADDAVSRAAEFQADALDERNHDLRIAAALTQAALTLPRPTIDDRRECGAVLHSLIASNTDRVVEALAIDPDGSIRCSSDPHPTPVGDWTRAVMAAPEQVSLVLRQRTIFVGRKLTGALDGAGFIVMRLAPDHPGEGVVALPAPENLAGKVPSPCLWLLREGRWVPLDDVGEGEIPADPSRLGAPGGPPVRLPSRDGRDFLYSSRPFSPAFGLAGAELVASSDIRVAARWSSGRFLVRLGEIAVFFLCEFLLIAAGVNQVVTQPLRKLHDAVRTWRTKGTFDAGGLPHDPRELRELTASFATATQSLNQREQELRSSVARQELLMQEVHHRVKNNLQIIASLLNLQSARIKVPEARAEFQSARDRVRALSTLHRHLYAVGDLHAINMQAFFAELCSQLFQAMGEVEGDRIGISVSAPDVQIGSDQAVPIALIVTETVGNALKYAFPEGRRGMIAVILRMEPDDTGTLIVRDDGVAADPAAGAVKQGLGLQLVRGFAKQLGGRLTVTHAGGTCYEVTLRLERQRLYDKLKPVPERAFAP